MPDNMEIADWLMQEFVKWRANQAGHPSLRVFAKAIDVPNRQLSAWLNGKGVPTPEQLDIITQRLNILPPSQTAPLNTAPLRTSPLRNEKVEMSMIDTIVSNWAELSHDEQQQVFNLMSSFLKK